jgi:hypothetical protein
LDLPGFFGPGNTGIMAEELDIAIWFREKRKRSKLTAKARTSMTYAGYMRQRRGLGKNAPLSAE